MYDSFTYQALYSSQQRLQIPIGNVRIGIFGNVVNCNRKCWRSVEFLRVELVSDTVSVGYFSNTEIFSLSLYLSCSVKSQYRHQSVDGTEGLKKDTCCCIS